MKFKTVFIVALMATLWSTDSFSQECKPVTFDGYTYDVVQIGDQCWFAENLRTRRYANGDEIPSGLNSSDWSSTTSGAVAVYGEGESSREELLSNLNTYGGLYNWYAVDDARGLCPTGWHVPSDEDWQDLEVFLGMSRADLSLEGYRGSSGLGIGTKLKAKSGWKNGGNGSDELGFSALAGGFRWPSTVPNGDFYDEGYSGVFWSSSPNGTYAWRRRLYTGNTRVGRDDSKLRYGFSVRCVRDE